MVGGGWLAGRIVGMWPCGGWVCGFGRADGRTDGRACMWAGVRQDFICNLNSMNDIIVCE